MEFHQIVWNINRDKILMLNNTAYMKRSNLINNACIYNKYITIIAFQILNNLEIVLNKFLLKYIIFHSSKTASVRILSLSTAHIPLRTNGDTTRFEAAISNGGNIYLRFL